MNRLTPEEHDEASRLGRQLVKLLADKKPLIAGFALAAVVKAMPPKVQDTFNEAKQRILRALSIRGSSN